jgi:hypothetical protein
VYHIVRGRLSIRSPLKAHAATASMFKSRSSDSGKPRLTTSTIPASPSALGQRTVSATAAATRNGHSGRAAQAAM